MTQDKLNYLLVLAEEQNVTRAARRLYITQPTLTGFLNRLEQDLGLNQSALIAILIVSFLCFYIIEAFCVPP